MKNFLSTTLLIIAFALSINAQSYELEPNDNMANAEEFTTFPQTFYARINPGNDTDVFKIVVPEGGIVSIMLDHVPATMDLIPIFSDSAHSLLFFTTVVSQGDSLLIEALVCAGTYYVYIFDIYQNNGSTSYYHLSADIDLSDPCECNEVYSTACEVSIDTCVQTRIFGITSSFINAGTKDKDFYKLSTPTGGVLTVEASNVPSDQSIRLSVSDDSSIFVAPFIAPANGQNVTATAVIPAGTYYIQVTEDSSLQDPYTMNDTLFDLCFTFDSSETCEYNNDTASACLISLDTCITARLYGFFYDDETGDSKASDVDFYKLTPATSCILSAKTLNTPSNKKVILNAYDSDFFLIGSDSATENGMNDSVKVYLAGGSTYFISVGEYEAGPNTINDSLFQVCFSCAYDGIEDIPDYSSFNVYPNPSAGILRFDFKKSQFETMDISVRNIVGEKISDYKHHNFDEELKVSLPDGIYFLTFSNESTVITRKILIHQ